MGIEFVTEFRRVGNSVAVIVPKSTTDFLGIKEGDLGRIQIQKISRETVEIMQLREKYNYEGIDGKILLGGKQIGTVKRIFLNTGKIKCWYGDETDLHKKEKIITFGDGVVFGDLSKKNIIDMFGHGFQFLDYLLPLEFEVAIEDKDKKKYYLRTESLDYHLASKGFKLDSFPFDIKVEKFELAKSDKS